MYLQICIPPEDRPMFRFLWRNFEVDRKPDIYKFERVLFGDASSPFHVHYISQEDARIHQEEFPLAAVTVSVTYCNQHRPLYYCIPRGRYNLHVKKKEIMHSPSHYNRTSIIWTSIIHTIRLSGLFSLVPISS